MLTHLSKRYFLTAILYTDAFILQECQALLQDDRSVRLFQILFPNLLICILLCIFSSGT